MEVVEGKETSVIPDSVMDAVNRTLASVEQVRAQCLEFVALSDPDVLAKMPPLQQPGSLLLLARAATTLFALRLRCNGINPDEHPVKSELERLRLYQDKVQRFIDLSKAPARPSTTLNYQAATRFIEHSLPDLKPEQRQSMRNISRGEGKKAKYLETNAQKKRKFQSVEKKSVQTAAKEFLEKASQELFGHNKGGIKGPLRIVTSSSSLSSSSSSSEEEEEEEEEE